MRFIPTKTHGYVDYLTGLLLIVSPWVFDFYRGGAETWIPVILGVGAVLYSLLTDYELGAKRIITMRTHLTIDFLSGAFLAASPWLFGFNDYISTPHFVLGIFAIVMSLITKTHPAGERQNVKNEGHRTTSAY
jgi:hypothetical protein